MVRTRANHPARLGGEEFALLLDGWDMLDAYHEAERPCPAVQALVIPVPGSTLVTISIGVAGARRWPDRRSGAGNRPTSPSMPL